MTEINELFGLAEGAHFEPTELEVEQARNLKVLEAELEQLRQTAEAPETGAVEKPAKDAVDFEAKRQELLGAMGNAKSRDESTRAINEYNSLMRSAYGPPAPAPPPIASMTPQEVHEAVRKAGDEATSADDLFKRYRELGISR